jgi:hypothetical protein
MNFFRSYIIRLAFLIFTGLAFLNMSFFLAELAVLESKYNKKVIENIARLFVNSLSEEETDTSETTESIGSAKVIDILAWQMHNLQFEKTDVENILKKFGHQHCTHGGYLEIVTPPPDKALIG